ncbi:MAG: hypothetical protein R3F60_25695 [bacterium]
MRGGEVVLSNDDDGITLCLSSPRSEADVDYELVVRASRARPCHASIVVD